MVWCWFSGAPTPDVPGIEHYQKRVGASRFLNYHERNKIVHKLELNFHRRGAEIAEQNIPLENRGMPIL